MTTYGFNEVYEAAETGAVQGVPEAVYDLEVTATRTLPASRLIFVDFSILAGPSAGKPLNVTLYVPNKDDANFRNQMFHFRKKIAGFLSDEVKAAFTRAESAATIEDAFEIIATSLVGRRLTADVGLVTAEGKYKGTNELRETKPLDGAPTPAAPTSQPYVTPQTQPQPSDGNSQTAAYPQTVPSF
jgi:hypothetical protein